MLVPLARSRLLVMPDHLINNKSQELFRKLWVKLSVTSQFPQPRNLRFFTAGIGGGQGVLGLVGSDRFGNAKPFGQDVNQRSVDIVNRSTETGEHWIG